MNKSLIFLIITLIFFSCANESTRNIHSPYLKVYQGRILDPYGREIILRGVNFSERHKKPPFLPGYDKYNGNEKEFVEAGTESILQIKSWGMNAVRFLIIWEAIEPEPFNYDYQYLNKVKSWVEEFTKNGIYVILDMHQDLYSRYFGGDGAPYWAVDKSIPYEPFDIWYINYLTPAVIANWDKFWEKEDLQEHYALSWKLVAEMFKDYTPVAGYEIMNEPYWGTKNPLTPEFERNYLVPFYERVIEKIRSVDRNHIIFIEPCVMKDGGFTRSFISNPGDENIVYFPHYYDPFVQWTHPYDGNEKRTYNAILTMEEEAERNDFALGVGEWGILINTENAKEYVEDHLKIFDEFRIGWFWWNYNLEDWDQMSPVKSDLSPRCYNNYCFLDSLKRVEPSVVAGITTKISYEPEEKIFNLCFKNSETVTLPETEILIPEGFYPEGPDVEVSDGTYIVKEDKIIYTHNTDFEEHCLKIQ